jgi:alpha-beta hydrolase superfamily lysophospholipase
MSLLRRFALVLSTIYALGSIVIGVLLAENGLRPPRSKVTAAQEQDARALADANGIAMESVSVDAADAVVLRGWFFAARDPQAATVLVTHGVTGHRGHALALAHILLGQGFALLTPDARAHGESGGELASFGVRERDDLRRWVDFIAKRRPGTCLVGVGPSMGAAHLLQAATGEPRLCGVVAESTFSSFREVAFDRVGQRVHTGPWLGRTVARPAIEAGFLYARLRYGLDLGRASPAGAVRTLQTPVLLVHGTADPNIPVRHAEAIRWANSRIRVWLVPGGGHGVWPTAGDEFPRRISEFVREVSVPR